MYGNQIFGTYVDLIGWKSRDGQINNFNKYLGLSEFANRYQQKQQLITPEDVRDEICHKLCESKSINNHPINFANNTIVINMKVCNYLAEFKVEFLDKYNCPINISDDSYCRIVIGACSITQQKFANNINVIPHDLLILNKCFYWHDVELHIFLESTQTPKNIHKMNVHYNTVHFSNEFEEKMMNTSILQFIKNKDYNVNYKNYDDYDENELMPFLICGGMGGCPYSYYSPQMTRKYDYDAIKLHNNEINNELIKFWENV